MTSNNVSSSNPIPHDYSWQTLIEFTLSRESSSASLTTDRIAEAVQTLNWSDLPLEQLKQALAQAIRNMIERSRLYDSATPLLIRVLIPKDGETTSRGWGFFLVQKQADKTQATIGASQHIIELFLYQESHPPFR